MVVGLGRSTPRLGAASGRNRLPRRYFANVSSKAVADGGQSRKLAESARRIQSFTHLGAALEAPGRRCGNNHVKKRKVSGRWKREHHAMDSTKYMTLTRVD